MKKRKKEESSNNSDDAIEDFYKRLGVKINEEKEKFEQIRWTSDKPNKKGLGRVSGKSGEEYEFGNNT